MKSKIKTLETIVLTVVIALVMTACDIFGDLKKEVDNSQYYLDPPTGLVATKISSNTILLTWNEVSGAKNYEITYRTDLESGDTRRSAGTSSITRYEHNYYSWYITDGVTTLYYYVKTHPSKSGYIASDWSYPVSVDIK